MLLLDYHAPPVKRFWLFIIPEFIGFTFTGIITDEPLEERKKPNSCPHSISNLERVFPLQLDTEL
jgi:hypothetical protein